MERSTVHAATDSILKIDFSIFPFGQAIMLDEERQNAIALQSAADEGARRKAKKRIQNRVAQRAHRQRMKAQANPADASTSSACLAHNYQTSYTNAQLPSAMSAAPLQSFSTGPYSTGPWQEPMTTEQYKAIEDFVYNYTPSEEDIPGLLSDQDGESNMSSSGTWSSHGSAFGSIDSYDGASLPNTPPVWKGSSIDFASNDLLQNYCNQQAGLDYNAAAPLMSFDNSYTMSNVSNDNVNFLNASSGDSSSKQLLFDHTSFGQTDMMDYSSSVTALEGFSPRTRAISQPTTQQASSTRSNSVEPQSRPSPDASLECRMAYMSQQAALVGFQNLDALAVKYYTTSFHETSPLFSDQSLSRNRRLPKLVANIRQAARDWSEWEQRGYQQEIVNSAEELLLSEWTTFKSHPRFAEWLSLVEKENIEDSTEDIVKANQILQEEAPNLWALNTTLLGSSMLSCQSDQVKATLNIMKILVGLGQRTEQ